MKTEKTKGGRVELYRSGLTPGPGHLKIELKVSPREGGKERED